MLDFRLSKDNKSKLRNLLGKSVQKGGINKVDRYPSAFEGIEVSPQELELAISNFLRVLAADTGPANLRCLHLFVTAEPPASTPATATPTALERRQMEEASAEAAMIAVGLIPGQLN